MAVINNAINNPFNGIVNGRLTFTTGTPVTTSDVTGASAVTVYFTPFRGNNVPVYNGTSGWNNFTFTELSMSVPATTATMYDVFLVNTAGVLSLATMAWTNDTTRATGLVLQNGLYVLSGTTTDLYLGSFRTTSVSGQGEDSLAKRWLWSYFNRVIKPMKAVEATGSWNYSTAAWRQANGSAANQLDMVIGVAEDEVQATAFGNVFNSTATTRSTSTGIGINSTTANSATIRNYVPCNNSVAAEEFAHYIGYPAIGRVTLPWLEFGAGADTQTWNGTSTFLQMGISGYLTC